jgi:hypothetical protein
MRRAPPNQVRFGVPNLIRATGDSRLLASCDLREPDSSGFRLLDANSRTWFGL